VPARRIIVETARAGYASCHLVVSDPVAGKYRLEISSDKSAPTLQVSVYREWFHYVPSLRQYFPDALIPIRSPYPSALPEPDNRVPKQTAQAFWIDIWAPATIAAGEYTVTASVRSGGNTSSLPIVVKILSALVPAQDAVSIDHNSYGTSWFAGQYPRLCERTSPAFFQSAAFFELVHSYHRIFYEHRGIYHQLGYGHAGKVEPEFAPRLEGSGKSKHIADWTLFDRQYGPLLDGSAFVSTHRGPKPIPFVYLPINPEWPASFEWWGEHGYEREFVNVVSAMERHFREKRWTATRFEMFFNQKKRYKGFSWDGDETRFAKDYAPFREYARLLKLAVPADSPIKFVFRADVSWTMERQWRELAGVLNFWVCSGGMFDWYPYAPQMLKGRGDVVWTYGSTPPVTEPSSHITLDVLRPWIQGIDGFVRWETTSAGLDPWFQFAGGGENLVYPGDRFGIGQPIPSIRLKLERNAVQDLSLLDSLAKKANTDRLRAGATHAFNRTDPREWWSARPKLADTNPEEWSNADIEEAAPLPLQFGKLLDAAAWQRTRDYIFQAAEEAR